MSNILYDNKKKKRKQKNRRETNLERFSVTKTFSNQFKTCLILQF